MDETGNSQVAGGAEGQEAPPEPDPTPQVALSLSKETWMVLAQLVNVAKTDGEAIEQFLAAIGRGYTVSVTLKE